MTQQRVVLATDYDGTLAHAGRVPPAALAALARLRAAGGLVVLVTGRRWPELVEVFPEVAAATDLVVAENGGLLRTATTSTVLATLLPPGVEQVLQSVGIHGHELGEVVVSAAREDEGALHAAAAVLQPTWPCQVVPNKDRVMLMPAGVDKGTGLVAALAHLGATDAHVVAIGDGENDAPLLAAAAVGIAVSDGVPALRAVADRCTLEPGPAGVIEVVESLLSR